MKIELDSSFGKKLGFTSDKFEGYLWLEGDYVMISLIISKLPGQGNLLKLFDRILSLGYGIKVPVPSVKMSMILVTHNFKKGIGIGEDGDPYEEWTKEVSE